MLPPAPGGDSPAAEPPAPPGPSGRPRVAALIEIALCSGFPTQLALAVILTRAGIAPAGGGELSLLYVATLSLGDAALLVGLIVCFLRRGGEQPAAVLLGPRPRLPEALLGLAFIPLTMLLAWAGLDLLHTFQPGLRNVSDNPMEALIRSPFDAAIFTVVAVVAGGLREEIQRAFILHRFEQQLGGGWLGLAVFSVVFGAGHYIQGWDAVVVTALLGAVWGALFLVRRSIVPAVVSHAGFNVGEILIVMAGAAAA